MPYPKEVPQNSKAARKLPQSLSEKLPKTTPQSYSPALLPNAEPQSCSPKLLPQNYDSANLFAKTAQSYSAKRLPKAAPESYYWKLLPEIVCKVAPESCSPKLLFFKIYIYILFNFTYIYINYLCKLILHNVARNIQYYPILTNGFQPGTKKNVRDNFGLEMSGN